MLWFSIWFFIVFSNGDCGTLWNLCGYLVRLSIFLVFLSCWWLHLTKFYEKLRAIRRPWDDDEDFELSSVIFGVFSTNILGDCHFLLLDVGVGSYWFTEVILSSFNRDCDEMKDCCYDTEWCSWFLFLICSSAIIGWSGCSAFLLWCLIIVSKENKILII